MRSNGLENHQIITSQPHGKFAFGRNQGKFVDRRDKSFSKIPGPYFACGVSGHCAAECANKKVPSQKCDKAMMATWSDSEDEDFVCSDKSSNAEEDVIAFVVSV